MTSTNSLATANATINYGKTVAIGSGGGENLRVSSAWVNAVTTDSASVTHGAVIPYEASLYRFDVPTDIGAGKTISSATLHIYGGGCVMNAPAVFVYPITDTSWTEAAVTWANQPTRGASLGKLNVFRSTLGTLASAINADTCNAWQTMDLTSYVVTQYAASAKAELMLYPDAGYNFTTSFGARQGSYAPYITVVYT